jgi:hypothetical protein
VIEGAMIGGFALVAVSAHYRVTGVMSYMVSYDVVVYQKDLGPDSLSIVKAMERYNPIGLDVARMMKSSPDSDLVLRRKIL